MKELAIDFETYLISEEQGPYPKPVCLSYYDGENKGLITDNMESWLSTVLAAAAKGQYLIIAHNAAFEAGVIYIHFPSLRKPLLESIHNEQWRCTMIREKHIELTRHKRLMKLSLDKLVMHYFKEDISESKGEDSWRMRYNELDGVPKKDWPQEAVDYAIEDSIWSYKIYFEQKDHNCSNFTTKSALNANIMSAEGIKINKDRVIELENEVFEKLKPYYEYLSEHGIYGKYQSNKKPPFKQKKFQNYVKNVVESPLKTAKGAISTGKKELLHYLKIRHDPIIEARVKILEYEKIITAYTPRLKANKIWTQYDIPKETCRTSSRGSKDFPSCNIQQMPRKVEGVKWDVRNCFVPRQGFKIVSIDYSSAELLSCAHQLYKYYGKSQMRNFLNDGDRPSDLHSRLAAAIMSDYLGREISYKDFIINPDKHYRNMSKPIGLGFPGGRGRKSIGLQLMEEGIEIEYIVIEEPWFPTDALAYAHMFNLSKEFPEQPFAIEKLGRGKYCIVIDEMVFLKQKFMSLYPELRSFLKDGHKNFQNGKCRKVKDDFGEWEWEELYSYKTHGFERDNCTYTAFCNGFLMQTPGAIGALRALNEIVYKYQEDERVNIIAFIHDEFVFEVKDCPEKDNIIKDLAYIMVKEMKTELYSVRVTVEAEEMDYWSKDNTYNERKFWMNYDSEVLHEAA